MPPSDIIKNGVFQPFDARLYQVPVYFDAHTAHLHADSVQCAANKHVLPVVQLPSRIPAPNGILDPRLVRQPYWSARATCEMFCPLACVGLTYSCSTSALGLAGCLQQDDEVPDLQPVIDRMHWALWCETCVRLQLNTYPCN